MKIKKQPYWTYGSLYYYYWIKYKPANELRTNYISIAKNLSGETLADLNELVQKYDGLINDTIPDLIESMQEAAYEKIGLKVQALTVEANLKLNVNEAKKTWEEFKNTLFFQ